MLAVHLRFGSILLRAWTGSVTCGHVQTVKGKEQVNIPVYFKRTVLSSDSPKTIAAMAFGTSHCFQSPAKDLSESCSWAEQSIWELKCISSKGFRSSHQPARAASKGPLDGHRLLGASFFLPQVSLRFHPFLSWIVKSRCFLPWLLSPQTQI